MSATRVEEKQVTRLVSVITPVAKRLERTRPQQRPFRHRCRRTGMSRQKDRDKSSESRLHGHKLASKRRRQIQYIAGLS